MTTAGILLRNESLKTFKRLAFLVTAGLFTLMVTIGFGQQFLRARSDPESSFALPDAWNEILSDPIQIAMFFSATVLILLIGSEYSWKTARQNVIDGLSRNQWFAGKLLLLPMTTTIFLAAVITIGGGFALAGTPDGAAFMTLPQARILGAATLALFGLGSIAIFFAFVARSSGPGIGMFFLWIALLEGVGGSVLRQVAPAWDWLADWFPGQHFLNLASASNWDPAAYARAIARAIEREVQAPSPPADPQTLVFVSIGYIVLFLGAAYLVYRSRDL